MTAPAGVALAVAALAAIADWIAVATDRRRLEYVAKPLTMAALIVVAATLDTGDERRAWFVAAGVLSLAGDVFLMLPRDRFVPGLVAFLGAHICYVVGLLQLPVDLQGLAVGAVVVALALATIGRRVVTAVRRGEHRALFAPVLAYMVIISAMVAAAFATGPWLAIAGAVLFYASDSLIAERRFVHATAWAPVAIMVTYHLGQAGLMLSLAAL